MSRLAEFAADDYGQATLQLLYPGSDTEAHLYKGGTLHGLNVNNFTIPATCEEMTSLIRTECKASSAFESLSARAHGLWPLPVLTSRHHRIPVPPHFCPSAELLTDVRRSTPLRGAGNE